MNQEIETHFPAATGVADTPLAAVLQGTTQYSQAAVSPAAPVAPAATPPTDDDIPGYNRFLELVEGETPKQDSCVIQLYAEGCFDCRHLVDGASTDFAKCHFSKGNAHCPASNLRIQFVGARVKWDKKIHKIEAMEAGIARRNAQTALFDEARDIEEESLREYVMGRILR